MTESEWLVCTDPREMLEALQAGGLLPERKARLFAAACCRRIWHLLRDGRSRRAVEIGELLADGLVTEAEADAAGEAAAEAADAVEGRPYEVLWRAATAAEYLLPRPGEWELLHTVWEYVATALEGERLVAEGATPEVLSSWSEQSVESGRTLGWTATNPDAVLADVLREVVGRVPFRPLLPVKPAWLTWHGGIVRRLAEDAYGERELLAGALDLDRLAVLADALEEAGCDQADLLGHLRGPGPHIRGCWAVDLVLGKQ
jgi:hypothetical protein